MECAPDLSFLTMAANSMSDLHKYNTNGNDNHPPYIITTGGGGGGTPVGDLFSKTPRSGIMIKQRKTNFTPREVEALLLAVEKRRDIVLFGTAGGQIWARAWQEVAREVTNVEGIHRTEGDVRKKWTYLKWEAKNTSKPGRDPTSRAVLEILTGGDTEGAPSTIGGRSMLEELLVPPKRPTSVDGATTTTADSSSQSPLPPVTSSLLQKTNNASSKSPPTPYGFLPSPDNREDPMPEVCLRWNSYHKNMQTFFPSLLNNEQFVDVTLACEGQSIKCHKIILSACSTYFEELLSQNPCQHPIILMKDLIFWEIQALVDFMYRGEVNVPQDKLPQLLKAAEALQIKGLAGPTSTMNNSHFNDEDSQVSSPNSEVIGFNNRKLQKRKSSKEFNASSTGAGIGARVRLPAAAISMSDDQSNPYLNNQFLNLVMPYAAAAAAAANISDDSPHPSPPSRTVLDACYNSKISSSEIQRQIINFSRNLQSANFNGANPAFKYRKLNNSNRIEKNENSDEEKNDKTEDSSSNDDVKVRIKEEDESELVVDESARESTQKNHIRNEEGDVTSSSRNVISMTHLNDTKNKQTIRSHIKQENEQQTDDNSIQDDMDDDEQNAIADGYCYGDEEDDHEDDIEDEEN